MEHWNRSAMRTETRYCMWTWSDGASMGNQNRTRSQGNRPPTKSCGNRSPTRSQDNGPSMRRRDGGPSMRSRDGGPSMGSQGSGSPMWGWGSGPPTWSQGNRYSMRSQGSGSVDIISFMLIFQIFKMKPIAWTVHSCLICRWGCSVKTCRLLWVLASLVWLSAVEHIMREIFLPNQHPNNHQHPTQKQWIFWSEASASLWPWDSMVHWP